MIYSVWHAAVLVCFLLVASLQDIQWRLIHNSIPYAISMSGIVFHLVYRPVTLWYLPVIAVVTYLFSLLLVDTVWGYGDSLLLTSLSVYFVPFMHGLPTITLYSMVMFYTVMLASAIGEKPPMAPWFLLTFCLSVFL